MAHAIAPDVIRSHWGGRCSGRSSSRSRYGAGGVQSSPEGTVAKLIYRAAVGEVNQVEVELDSTEGRPPAYLLKSSVATSIVAGCEPAPDANVIRCSIPDGTRPTGPLLELGDKNDRAVLPAGLHLRATVLGGRGNDRLFGGGLLDGGLGIDRLSVTGRAAARLEGGPGRDLIFGGPGGDAVDPGSGQDKIGSGAGADRVRADDRSYDDVACGAGRDRVVLDGFDLHGSCEHVRRTAPPRAIPISIDDDGFSSWVVIVCPSDSPRPCVSEVTVATPNGRRVDRRTVRLQRGRTKYARSCFIHGTPNYSTGSGARASPLPPAARADAVWPTRSSCPSAFTAARARASRPVRIGERRGLASSLNEDGGEREPRPWPPPLAAVQGQLRSLADGVTGYPTYSN